MQFLAPRVGYECAVGGDLAAGSITAAIFRIADLASRSRESGERSASERCSWVYPEQHRIQTSVALGL